MKRRRFQLSDWQRRAFYGLSLALLFSGAAWAWLQHNADSGQAGDAWRDLKPSLLMVHGVAAPCFVLLLGSLLPGHVRRAWHARKNRANGGLFLGSVALLTISGFALYYLGDETWRDAVSKFHLWLGLGAPFLLGSHILQGRRATCAKGLIANQKRTIVDGNLTKSSQ